jgi:TatD DNase family protein
VKQINVMKFQMTRKFPNRVHRSLDCHGSPFVVTPFVMFFDAHNHFQDAWLAPHHEVLLQELSRLGVAGMVVNGSCETDWPDVEALAKRVPWIIPSYGVHPWDCGNRIPGWENNLRRRLEANPSACVGEIGLDRWMLERARPDDPRLAGMRRAPIGEQKEAFLLQLELAHELNRPASIHCLDAWGMLLELLQGTALPGRGFLLHSYGGPEEMIPAFAKLGAYFSFNGSFLDTRRAKVREAFRHVPAERLLVETDAPATPPPEAWRRFSLPPAPGGEALNHPSNIVSIYSGLAGVLQVSEDALQAQVAANFSRLYRC